MAESASLKRLGGGRWQSRDGRFAIEPQSGTWVVVDSERTNELGLPLVRGPFPSLTAARSDIEAARAEGDAASPLATRIAAAPTRPDPVRGRSATATGRSAGRAPREPASALRDKPDRRASEPAWLRALDTTARDRARRLIARLEESGVDDAAGVVRSDVVGDQPALARLAITRRMFEAIGSKRDPEAVAQAVADALVGGHDRDLGVRWRLVDGDGRAVERLDLPGAKGRTKAKRR